MDNTKEQCKCARLCLKLLRRLASDVRIAIIDELLEGTKIMATLQDIVDKAAQASDEMDIVSSKVDELLANQGGGGADQAQIDAAFDAVSALEGKVAATVAKVQ